MKARTQWEKARLPAYGSMRNPYGGVEVMRLDGEADLDAWIRRRTRMRMWKQWRFPRTRIARLRAMGVPEPDAISTGSSNKGYWRLAKTKASNIAMDLQWFPELDLISIKDEWIALNYPK